VPYCAGRASTLRTWPHGDSSGSRASSTLSRPRSVVPKCLSLVKENRALQAANARLTKKLKNAELIIEVQKKVAALLGNPIPNIQIDEEN